MNRNYALLIGVHAYRNYDPSGAADVPGAGRDAISWVRACLSMGFAPENIRVLTSPPIAPEEIGPGAAKSTFGDATRAGIVDGLTWLSTALDGAAPASGLLTFSGHGDEGEDGFPILCPSDTTPTLEEVIDLGSLRAEASVATREGLTILLDCCHAEAGRSASESLRTRLRAKSAGRSTPHVARARTIAACGRDQSSFSARFLGEEMGAFTWAAASALGQWQTVVEDGVARLDVAYGDVLSRARSLLSALSFEQTPVLSGPAGVADLAFLHPGDSGRRGETSRAPTANRSGHQLDGGEIPAGEYIEYVVEALIDKVTSTVGYIYVTTTQTTRQLPMIGNTQMRPGTEYWALYSPSSDVGGVYRWWSENYASISELRFSAVEPRNTNVRYTPQYPCFTASEATEWRSNATSVPADAFVFSSPSTASSTNLRGVALQFQNGAPLQWWWLQKASGSLTSQDLTAVSLVPQSKDPPSADYYAPSVLAWFDPG
ncbi:MAG: caspase family protein [Polyangiaceae bacterium]